MHTSETVYVTPVGQRCASGEAARGPGKLRRVGGNAEKT
jgi:hypothetical protein